MCLDIVLYSKKKKEVLAKLKDTITVWKVLRSPTYGRRGGYVTSWLCTPVYAGEVTFKQNSIRLYMTSRSYRGGGHFWLTKEGALDWGVTGIEKLVRCTIKKANINTIGKQAGYPVVVVKKATFPQYIGGKKSSNGQG